MKEYIIKFNQSSYSVFENEDELWMKKDTTETLLKTINERSDIKYGILSLKCDYYIDDFSEIKIDDVSYFNINIVFLLLRKYLKQKSNEFIESLSNATEDLSKYIWTFLLAEKKLQKEVDDLDYLYEYADAFQTLKKISVQSQDYQGGYYMLNQEIDEDIDYLKYLEKIRELNNLSEDFGVLKDEIDFNKIISESFLDIDDVNTSFNAANILYMIVKEKPFVKYNYEIAIILAAKSLKDTNFFIKRYDEWDNIINKRNDINVSSSDMLYAIKYIEDNIDKPRIDVIKNLESIFDDKPLEIKDYQKEKLLNEVKLNSTLENVYRYIVYFTENYRGYQGFYEFYRGKIVGAYKIHYNGIYTNFRFNYTQSLMEKNTLVFDADALAFTEAPTDLKHRNYIMQALFDEIKERSYECIMEQYIESLKKELNQYYDISSLNFKFNLNWSFESDSDYEW